jgi:hypothetical protein
MLIDLGSRLINVRAVIQCDVCRRRVHSYSLVTDPPKGTFSIIAYCHGHKDVRALSQSEQASITDVISATAFLSGSIMRLDSPQSID